MMHSHLTYHISVLDTLLRLPLIPWGSNGRCINSTCAWPLRLPRTAPRACTPQRYLTIMLSVNGVSVDRIGDHISVTLGRARAKAAKNGRSAGRTPAGEGRKRWGICVVHSFFARIGPARGRGGANNEVLISISILSDNQSISNQ